MWGGKKWGAANEIHKHIIFQEVVYFSEQLCTFTFYVMITG